jgi:CubicO group peptidase (beta-lactamase class C family)
VSGLGADGAAIEAHGLLEPGFEPVRDAFLHNFAKGRELGAAFCVHVGGRKVVDIWAGYFDEAGTRPYGDDALQLVFSTTKGATAICANVLAQRGELDLDAPVSEYWPEFAKESKEALPVRYLLTHQAGLPAVDRHLSPEELWAWDPAIEALEAQAPFWEPGTAHGYHAVSYGYLVGEVVRRVTGRSLGTFFAEEIARPLGLEFYIGLPAELEARVSPLATEPIDVPADGSGPEGGAGANALAGFASTLLARALSMGGAIRDVAYLNQREWHAAEVPAANGITNARSLSRLYAALIGPVDGGPSQPLFEPAQLEKARTVHTSGPDQVFASVGMPLEQRIGLGFWRANEFAQFGGEGAFGHSGAGGSYGFCDPELGLSVGYVMNKMSASIVGDPRARRLVNAVYQCVGSEAKYS